MTRTELSKNREVASNLYEKLTSYDAFLFIYMYRDLAGTMAKTTKLLQSRDIRIRDVGRWIMNLCERLKGNYTQGSDVPTALLGDGTADDITSELFGKNGRLSTFIFEHNF